MGKLKDFLHKKLNLTYRLHIADDFGEGQPVVFLHGISSSSDTWNNVLPLMVEVKARVITIDLLGFGASPRPDWLDYSLRDHAKAVAMTIRKLNLTEPPIIVGHSMGALIATEVVSQNPGLAKRLILCSIPLYLKADYDKSVEEYAKTGRRRTNIYFKLYEALVVRKDFTLKSAQRMAKLDKDIRLDLNDENWIASERSFKNAIIEQDTITELEKLQLPIDILYGRLDLIVISDYYTALADINPNITVTPLTTGHGISLRYAKTLVQILDLSLGPKPVVAIE